MSLKQIEDHLPLANFLRVHKSYVVALRKITALDAANVRVGAVLIPVGRTYRAHLKSRLNLLGPL